MKRCLLLLAALMLACPLGAVRAGEGADDAGIPRDCSRYQVHPRRETCLNARKYGMSINAAALVQGLAERTHAVEFCRSTPDPAEQRHRDSLLAGSPNLRALYEAHLAMLRQRCVYDPDGWCQSMGFTRR